MTSNAGTDLITKLCADPDTAPDAIDLAEALRPELMKHFKPAFLGRTTLVPYFPLPGDIIRRIITMQLDRVGQRVRQNYGAAFSFTDAVIDVIADRCTENASGARNVENILSRTLLPELSGEILSRLAANTSIEEVTVVTDADGGFAYTLR
jgi:type VI secretion system protein VasG